MSIPFSISAADDLHMARALSLAQHAAALAHPNPRVGCVIVRSGQVFGEGFHSYDEKDHAEIVALKKVGEKARGATLYVNLEPCCTTGRTGPCTQAILKAGIARVVASMKDPNPAVAGRSFVELKSAGVEVLTLDRQFEAARELNEDYAKWIQTGTPFVTLKTALTLDGQIARSAGSVTWITSEASRDAVQQIRHKADALVTGIGTVLADDPHLNDRTGLPRRRKLLRVVLDSKLRMPLKSKLIKSADGDLLIITSMELDSPRARALTRAGAEVAYVSGKRGRIDLQGALRELARRETLNVLLEAGAELNGAALEAEIVDKMILFYAPKVMGTGGVPMAQISSRLFSKLPPLTKLSVNRHDTDFSVQGYFHDVYGDYRSRRKN
jgi:diaminohydroxyphosphoribosylaminopyrimidine deaminase / 5-amino-6-(5-phosphoribosylamino)uracil reductase